MILPVKQAIPEIRRVLQNGNRAVLSAPPGAGKTTLVPLELMDESWLESKRIIMLEPRRLAAVAAASRMAELIGESPGKTVGYIIRGESAHSKQTKILVVTEGVLTQMLQDDPELPETGLIIFDEFHERSMQADLGLALTLDVQENLRNELRILVMSATLDVERVKKLLDDCPVMSAPGLSFPVETIYSKSTRAHEISRSAAAATVKMAKEEPGSVLVFLPGAGEIKAVQNFLEKSHLPEDVDIRPLYSGLDRKARNAAILPSENNHRKIVLATSVAETSLTIEGVRVVIDCGLSRLPRLRAASGLTMLETVRVSKASADQRRGRAGRLEAGICLRLWSEFEHRSLPEFTPPEILSSDAARLRLELARWGTLNPDDLKWLDPPPEAMWNSAGELLVELGLLDSEGRLTTNGRAAAKLPVHPRLGAMLLKARDLKLGLLGCAIAALLEEPRDIIRNDAYATLDLSEKIRLLSSKRDSRLNADACRRVLRQRDNLLRLLKLKYTECSLEHVGILTAFAYPDRIGKRRDAKGEKYLLSSGSGAVFRDADKAVFGEYIVAPLLGGHGSEPAIFTAAPLTEEEIREHFASLLKTEQIVQWDRIKKCVTARQQESLDAIILSSTSLKSPSGEKIASALCEGIRQTGLHVLPWDKATENFRARATFVRQHDLNFADVSDDALLNELEVWLAPFLNGMKNFNDLRKLNLKNILEARIGYDKLAMLKRMAPEKIEVPSGSKIRIDYSSEPPTLAVKLQEMFSCTRQPTLMDGKIPLKITLLSPAMRPVQTTSDIAGFWTGSYQLVRAEMRSRYPKHNWPEDPSTANPSARTIKRK
jgi:ATP-dependent RNA helicase HrpB